MTKDSATIDQGAAADGPAASDQAAEDSRDRQADADFAAGRGVPLEEVERWVDSWDTQAECLKPQARRLW